MGDYHLLMQFDVEATPEQVRPWLTAPERIAGWWSDAVTGTAATAGDTFTVRCPTTDVPFDLTVAHSDDRRIDWYVAETPPWWKGTTIRFELSPAENGGTTLLFSHRDLEPDNPVIPVITPAWVGFVQRLSQVAATGTPDPLVRS